MQSFQRVLIALDLSGMDDYLLGALRKLAAPLGVEKAYFLHVMPDFTVPKDVDVEFHKLFAPEYPVDEKVRDKLALDIQEKLGENLELETSLEIREGKPYNKLLHWTEVKEINLMAVGHKKTSEGSGITARRVARHAKCSVLFVPEKEVGEIKNILVPVDFSANSARAVRTALELKKGSANTTVTCLYIIDLPPSDYYMRPLQNSGFRGVLRESAENAYQKFLKNYELEESALQVEFLENSYSNIAVHIDEYAQNNEFDMLVLGAQGHSLLESFIFGSVTEKLVDKNKEQPILVIR